MDACACQAPAACPTKLVDGCKDLPLCIHKPVAQAQGKVQQCPTRWCPAPSPWCDDAAMHPCRSHACGLSCGLRQAAVCCTSEACSRHAAEHISAAHRARRSGHGAAGACCRQTCCRPLTQPSCCPCRHSTTCPPSSGCMGPTWPIWCFCLKTRQPSRSSQICSATPRAMCGHRSLSVTCPTQ